jgi:hypothetical protein
MDGVKASTGGRVSGSLAIVLAATLVASSCTASSSDATTERVTEVSRRRGGSVVLGSASIEIPPWALSRDARVSVRQLGETLTPFEEATGESYSFAVENAKLLHPVRLHLPIAQDSSAQPGAVAALTYKRGRSWKAVKGVVDPTGDTVSASVTHLSVWAALNPISSFLGRIADGMLQFLKVRATRPSCSPVSSPGRLDVIYASAALPDPPLWYCLEDDAPGNIKRLKVVNNRSFAMRLDPHGITVEPSSLLEGSTVEHLFAVAYSTRGELYIPPGAQYDFLWDASVTPSAVLRHDPDLLATAVTGFIDLAARFVEGVDLVDLGIKLNDCVRSAAQAIINISLGRALGVARDCFADLIRARENLGIKTIFGLKIAAGFFAELLLALSVVPLADAIADETLFGAAHDGIELRAFMPAPPAPSTASPSTTRRTASPPNPPVTSLSPSPVPGPADRYGTTSYDRLREGGQYATWSWAAQDFVAQSNTITRVGILVGNYWYWVNGGSLPQARVRLCTDIQCSGAVLAEAWPQLNNYAGSFAELGDISVTPGQTYWLRYEAPAPTPSERWVVYYFDPVTPWNNLAVQVLGYNR